MATSTTNTTDPKGAPEEPVEDEACIWYHFMPQPKDQPEIERTLADLPDDWYFSGSGTDISGDQDAFTTRYPKNESYQGPPSTKKQAMDAIHDALEEDVNVGAIVEYTFVGRQAYLLQVGEEKIKKGNKITADF
jgi:hypothetical protein